MRFQIGTRQSKLEATLAKLDQLTAGRPGRKVLRFYPAHIVGGGGQPWGGLLRIEDEDGQGYECGWLSGALGFSDAILLLDDDRIPGGLRQDLIEELH